MHYLQEVPMRALGDLLLYFLDMEIPSNELPIRGHENESKSHRFYGNMLLFVWNYCVFFLFVLSYQLFIS